MGLRNARGAGWLDYATPGIGRLGTLNVVDPLDAIKSANVID